ncbi:uncharacterized protein ALTATR162_LOCUS8068 [Alternaria atra]|uniref:Uncharacterized protein n=1 Tax=Alternaria atra TaxID=119953 RepID=A0A8J2IF60_9PLEO|nr:uncharacterized protein ALTATR162_LOCUS8068 [Alternaria atra]CAG5175385.1 unnamed protein product [Alternaria atra]
MRFEGSAWLSIRARCAALYARRRFMIFSSCTATAENLTKWVPLAVMIYKDTRLSSALESHVLAVRLSTTIGRKVIIPRRIDVRESQVIAVGCKGRISDWILSTTLSLYTRRAWSLLWKIIDKRLDGHTTYVGRRLC